MNYKNREQYKHLMRVLAVAAIVLLECAVFSVFWDRYYASHLWLEPFWDKGNQIIVVIYGIFLLVFMYIYGGMKIGYMKGSSIIYSQMMTAFCANALMYLQIILLWRHLPYILPMVGMTLVDFALAGIALLYQGDGGKPLSTIGIIFVLLSSLSYAIYIVGVNRSTLKNLSTTKLTFYAILFGLSVYIVRLNFLTDLQVIPTAWLWGDVLALAILPTAVSLVCTALAIHYIGSTPTAILGALEPVTALFFGVLLFHEKLTPRLMVGILMIITAVTLIIIGKSLIKKMSMLLQVNKK